MEFAIKCEKCVLWSIIQANLKCFVYSKIREFKFQSFMMGKTRNWNDVTWLKLNWTANGIREKYWIRNSVRFDFTWSAIISRKKKSNRNCRYNKIKHWTNIWYNWLWYFIMQSGIRVLDKMMIKLLNVAPKTHISENEKHKRMTGWMKCANYWLESVK